MTRRSRPARTTILDWVALNRNELSWTALLTGFAVLVGFLMNP
jgi:hypothetical protein